MKDIKVSIIVPVYKVHLDYLRTCLDSLAAQTLQECEFIVVSDGAPKAECAICEEYVIKDTRFKFFNRDHAGVSAARNFGLEVAQGEYISFVDSDDWVDKDIFEQTFVSAKKTNSDVTFWNYTLSINKKMIPMKYSSSDKEILSKENLAVIRENLLFVERIKFLAFAFPFCKLYRSSLLKGISFDRNLEIGEDRAFNLQVFSKEIRVAYLNRNSYFYRQNIASATKNYRNDAFEILFKLAKKLDELSGGECRAEISNNVLVSFDQSLSLDFFHKDNPHSFKENIRRIKQIFFSESFQHYVYGCSFRKLNLFHKIGYLFIKRKIFLWIYIRAVIFTIKRKIPVENLTLWQVFFRPL